MSKDDLKPGLVMLEQCRHGLSSPLRKDDLADAQVTADTENAILMEVLQKTYGNHAGASQPSPRVASAKSLRRRTTTGGSMCTFDSVV